LLATQQGDIAVCVNEGRFYHGEVWMEEHTAYWAAHFRQAEITAIT